jgi:phospholipase C
MPDDPIRHVVLLALENHAFDQMLGCFKAIYPELDGVDPRSPGRNVDDDGRVYVQAETTERQMPFDPHHELPNVAEHLKDGNGGFVRNFSRMYPNSTAEERQYIMGYYPLDFLPALHPLARHFTICDRWFSSLPGPTWPNRFMMLTGTAKGRVNMPHDGTHDADLAGHFQQDQDTIFDRLNEKAIHWKVYFHDLPQSWVLRNQRLPENAARYFYIDELFDDARGREEDFPEFCFVEPDYTGIAGNDDHPPHDIMKAQKLIADVYKALRANRKLWESTLLVVVYDEHGGFYDHVVPPMEGPPDEYCAEYSFNQLGMRVPAILVSPWVEARVESTQFDHTSLLRYLTDKWQLRPLPSRRVEKAKSIGIAIRDRIREDTLLWIELSADQLTPPKLEREEDAIAHTSAHDSALKRLRDYLWNEELPIAYPMLVRFLQVVRAVCDRLDPVHRASQLFHASIAEPDKLGTKDAAVKDDIARFLMRQKKRAVADLAARIRDESQPELLRRHAAQTLELISGRRLHAVEKLAKAHRLLERHGV